MASTYTSRIRLEKQADGENPNSWGLIMNQNVIELVDEAVAGYAVVSVSSVAVSLTANTGSSDEARKASLEFAGTLTADVTITIPSEEKTYFIRENTTGLFETRIKTAAGSSVLLPQGNTVFIACDGTEIYKLESSTSVSAFAANNISTNVLTAVSIETSILSVTGSATFGGDITTQNIVGDTASTYDIGTSVIPYNEVYTSAVGLADWDMFTSGTSLKFAYNGTNVFALTNAGALSVIDNITAYVTAV